MVDLVLVKLVGERGGPRHLTVHGSLVGGVAGVGEHDARGALVVRIGPERNQSVSGELIDDASDSLAREAHVVRDVGHGELIAGDRDSAENLPTGAGQAEVSDQLVAGGQYATIETEDRQQQISQRRAGGTLRRDLSTRHVKHITRM